MKIAIQLYTLRDLIQKPADLLALFPKLKALGFDGVEFAGFHGYGAAEIRAALDETGLEAIGAHVGLDDLRPKNLQKTLDFCKTLGMPRVGVGGADHGSPKKAAASCAVLKDAYDTAQAAGITVYYHNHESEFAPFKDGSLPMDLFRAACALELDTYWSFCAGVENYAFITENKDRICAIHIKDGAGKKTKALGEGNCDLAAVVRGANAIGMEWLVLENDDPVPDGLVDAARSMVWFQANM